MAQANHAPTTSPDSIKEFVGFVQKTLLETLERAGIDNRDVTAEVAALCHDLAGCVAGELEAAS